MGAHPRAAGPGTSPGGVARRVHGRPAVHLGWGRALLLQLAHPLVAAAVAEHSVFARQPAARWARWQRTLAALCALTAGSDEEAARVARAVDALHGRVQGRLREPAGIFPAGTAYSARDPALLRWVYAATVDSFPRAYERFVQPLAPEERDRYCAETRRMGLLLGVPDGDLPETWAELQEYLGAMLGSGEIVVTERARGLARELLTVPFPRGAGPLRRLGRLATIGLLPPAIRRAYGFPWEPRHEAALESSAALLRRLEPVLPSLPTVVRYAQGIEAVVRPAGRGPDPDRGPGRATTRPW